MNSELSTQPKLAQTCPNLSKSAQISEFISWRQPTTGFHRNNFGLKSLTHTEIQRLPESIKQKLRVKKSLNQTYRSSTDNRNFFVWVGHETTSTFYLVEISILSISLCIRPTKIIKRDNKNMAHFLKIKHFEN